MVRPGMPAFFLYIISGVNGSYEENTLYYDRAVRRIRLRKRG